MDVEPAGSPSSPLAATEQLVLTDPATGTLEFRETIGIAISDDGRRIDPLVDGIYCCRGCGRSRLTAASVTTCHACGEVTCRRCAGARIIGDEVITVCVRCKEPSPFASLAGIIKWIFSL